MKSLKKILSIFAAFMMVVGLTAANVKAQVTNPQNPATITITDANEGQSYSIYKIFDATHNTGTNASAYTINSKYAGIEELPSFTAIFDIDEKGNVTAKVDDKNEVIATTTQMVAFSQAALEFVKSKDADYTVPNATYTFVADANQTEGAPVTGTITVNDLEYGYYLIGTTTGSLVSLNSATPDVEIEDKNNVPPIDKKVVSIPSEYGVGDVIEYSITVPKTEGVAKSAAIKDTMSEGLTFNENSLKVNGVSLNELNGAYTLSTTPGNGENYTFKLTFNEAGLTALSNGNVVITYSAKVNADAVTVDDMNNTATLDFGNNSNASTDTTETNKPVNFDILKYTGTLGGSNQEVLQGAKFTLTRTDVNPEQSIKFTQANNGVYTKSDDNGTADIVSDENGKIVLKGLAAGSYTLIETEAPDGYNKLTAPIKFTVSKDGKITMVDEAQNSGNVVTAGNDGAVDTVNVLNTTGAQLPSTGGMGTTMIYIAGAILMVGAAIIFVTNKRMKHE